MADLNTFLVSMVPTFTRDGIIHVAFEGDVDNSIPEESFGLFYGGSHLVSCFYLGKNFLLMSSSEESLSQTAGALQGVLSRMGFEERSLEVHPFRVVSMDDLSEEELFDVLASDWSLSRECPANDIVSLGLNSFGDVS